MEDLTENEQKWIIVSKIKDVRSMLDDLFENIEEQNLITKLHQMLEKRFDKDSHRWRDSF